MPLIPAPITTMFAIRVSRYRLQAALVFACDSHYISYVLFSKMNISHAMPP